MRATVAVLGSGLCCLHLWTLRGIMAVETQPGVEVRRAARGGWAGAPVTVQGGWGDLHLPPSFLPRAHPPALSLPHKMPCLVQPGS